jgi:methanethiol oxidase
MVEISRDGKRIYFTNALYTPWDDQFYPDGARGWMVKVNVRPEGGMELDPGFFLESDRMRTHQVRLEGGDASSDSRLVRSPSRSTSPTTAAEPARAARRRSP